MGVEKPILFIMLFLIGIACIWVPNASADSENNDSFDTAETVGEGTVTGSVSISGVSDSDEDYYKVEVPEGKDLEVTVEKTDSDDGIITVNSYDSSRSDMYVLGIYMTLSNEGETDTESWYNSEGEDTYLYLHLSGDGEYSMTVDITSETEEAVEGLLAGCGIGLAGIACGGILFLVIIIVIIIVIVKLVKKKK